MTYVFERVHGLLCTKTYWMIFLCLRNQNCKISLVSCMKPFIVMSDLKSLKFFELGYLYKQILRL